MSFWDLFRKKPTETVTIISVTAPDVPTLSPDHARYMLVMEAADHFYNSVEGVQGDEIITYRFENALIKPPNGRPYRVKHIERILFGSETARDIEYMKRHGTVCPGYAVCWAAATTRRLVAAETWMPFKRLANGIEVQHPWVAAHEPWHRDKIMSRLRGSAREMSNPDILIKPESWK